MTTLQTRTYALLKTVPAGSVTTYKALADALGTKAYRAIGQFMRHNPYSYDTCDSPSHRVPCHRVVANNGTIGGFMGKTTGKTIAQKIQLLRREGVTVKNGKIQEFTSKLVTF